MKTIVFSELHFAGMSGVTVDVRRLPDPGREIVTFTVGQSAITFSGADTSRALVRMIEAARAQMVEQRLAGVEE